MACSYMGARNALADKIMLLGSFVVYLAIVVIYAGVLRMVPLDDIAPYHLTHAKMIWYLGTTEMILFLGSSWAFKEVQNAFLSYDAHLSLLRPVSYAFTRFSFWAGDSFVRALVFVPCYYLLMWWLSGELVMSASATLGMLLSLPLGVVMMNAASYMVGAACLWVSYSDPVFWVWHKLIFLLSAMLWPLLFYPVWLQDIIWFLPFPGILAHGGNWTLDLSPHSYWVGFLNQIIWSVLMMLILRFFDRLVMQRIQMGEG